MALTLDQRQRVMLEEMGVRVWLPGTDFAPEPVRPAAPRSGPTTPAAPQRHTGPAAGAVAPPIAVAAPPAVLRRTTAIDGSGWPELVQAAAACRACGLCAGRKQATLRAPLHAGTADWMVVGDSPDEDEDRLGMPFVEQAGLLLDNMLKAVRVSRQADGSAGAYLTNVVKCRPPVGRLPQPDDLAACATFLRREIALVQPRVIVAMGRFALQALLVGHPQQMALPLGKQRGIVYRYEGIPVVVTYHPQVLLRSSADKGKAWADLCLAVQVVRDTDASLQSAP